MVGKERKTVYPSEVKKLTSIWQGVLRDANLSDTFSKDGVQRADVGSVNGEEATLRSDARIKLRRTIRHGSLKRPSELSTCQEM